MGNAAWLCRACLLLAAALALASRLQAEEPAATGPETEKRFPPLKLPPGFQATLFACDPLIEYPSAMALGPRPGSTFLAQDYLTGLGTEIERRDEIRLVEDTDGDGHADKTTAFARGLNSIQGLCYHAGTVYAMHAPLLSAFRDIDGDGVEDERRDLLSGLGLPPEENPPRLHCANGVVHGHDGWLYLALGDHGCRVPRPEGPLVLEGGGILRVRPDGRAVHVFATGLRNIYDVALDDELNVFVRDNENDGGDYKVRVYQSFFGADHGYPYLYYERPEETLRPLADLGLGSSAGGLCYLEPAFPPEYRGSLFFCEWGRAVVTYQRERTGATFAPLKEKDFAAGADSDPYGFKPTDLVVDRDGSLLVADWADGQRPRRGRGRVYRIRFGEARTAPPATAAGDAGRSLEGWLERLDSESCQARVEAQEALQGSAAGIEALLLALRAGRLGIEGRFHAVWAVARILTAGASSLPVSGEELRRELFSRAEADPDPRVRAQAVRALADALDPALGEHGPDHPGGAPDVAARLARLGEGQDARVLLEVIVALGRRRWPETPRWVARELQGADAAIEHAAIWALRRAQNRSEVLQLLDGPDSNPARSIAYRSLSGLLEPAVAAGLIERLRVEPEARRRWQYADALVRIHKQPGPWVYWGYRPPPRPANTVSWERTEAIEAILDRTLLDFEPGLRLQVLRGMERERVPARVETLERWLAGERDGERVSAILDALRGLKSAAAARLLARVVLEKGHASAPRLAALEILSQGLDESSEDRGALFLELARSLEDGPILAMALRQLGKRPRLASPELLTSKLDSPAGEVRAAAIEALGMARTSGAGPLVEKLLRDADPRVVLAAASAAGKLGAKEAVETLLSLARSDAPGLEPAILESLRELREPRAVPVAILALDHARAQRAALALLGELGGPEAAAAVARAAKQARSNENLSLAVRTLTRWEELEAPGSSRRPLLGRALAEVAGETGVLLCWQVAGPLAPEAARALAPSAARPEGPVKPGEPAIPWRTLLAEGPDAVLDLAGSAAGQGEAAWLGAADLFLPEEARVQFLGSASEPFTVWLNGLKVHERLEARPFRPGSESFETLLAPGENRVIFLLAAPRAARLQLRFRRQSGVAGRERLARAALSQDGDPERGRVLFLDAAKSQCVRCHRLRGEGKSIGPELTGIGSRFSRIHLIESVLEPSRAIAPSFESMAAVLGDGRVLIGVKVAETGTTLTLGDGQGEAHELLKSDILRLEPQSQSLMPEGLEKQLSDAELVDLIAFLAAERDKAP